MKAGARATHGVCGVGGEATMALAALMFVGLPLLGVLA